MFLTTKDIGVYKIGDTFTIQLDGVTYPSLKNLGPDIATSAQLQVILPTGLIFDAGNSIVPRGTFSEITGIWSFGSFVVGETLTPTFAFEVTDDCEISYEIDFQITSNLCDCNFSNNNFTITASGLSCCKISECNASLENSTFSYHPTQAANMAFSVCDYPNRVYLITPTNDITITLTGVNTSCLTNSVVIKHTGTGANRLNKIRVQAASGSVDSDTYFEFDNSGSATNNVRGYNLTSYKFTWDGTNFWVFSE